MGIESTIVDATAPAPNLPILRRGGVEDSALSALGYTLSYPTPIIGRAPGTLKSHYAPSTPLYLLRHELTAPPCPRSGYLMWQKTLHTPYTRALTPHGDSVEAASRLFGCMRALDDSPCERIFVEPIPREGLGEAILDRLSRASSGFASWRAVIKVESEKSDEDPIWLFH